MVRKMNLSFSRLTQTYTTFIGLTRTARTTSKREPSAPVRKLEYRFTITPSP